MSTQTSKHKYKVDKNTVNHWEMAICDVEKKLEKAKSRVAQLKGALRTFKDNLRNGVPWPGESK